MTTTSSLALTGWGGIGLAVLYRTTIWSGSSNIGMSNGTWPERVSTQAIGWGVSPTISRALRTEGSLMIEP